jgi:hypothetical protein
MLPANGRGREYKENMMSKIPAAPRKRAATKITNPPTVELPATESPAPEAAPALEQALPVKAPKVRKSVAAAKPVKLSKPVKASKLAKAEKPPKAEKPAKIKLVRDSFTMPEADYAKLALLKERCLEAGVVARKSELLRLGLQVLAQLPSSDLAHQIETLERLKTGRPAKH